MLTCLVEGEAVAWCAWELKTVHFVLVDRFLPLPHPSWDSLLRVGNEKRELVKRVRPRAHEAGGKYLWLGKDVLILVV